MDEGISVGAPNGFRNEPRKDCHKVLFEVIAVVKIKIRDYWVFGLCPSSGILKNRRHNVLR
jgi:hypothetical protein